MLGETPEITNLELEELAIDPVNPHASRMWFNPAELRVKYAETGTVKRLCWR